MGGARVPPVDQRPNLLPTLLLCAVVLEAAFAGIHLAHSRVEQVRLTLWAYLVGGAAFAWLLWRIRNTWRDGLTRREFLLVVIAGAVFRLTLFPLTPAASTDVYRYLWEGLVQTHGHSPYVLPPDAPELASLADQYADIWRSINHPDVPAIYAPTAQVLFRANAVTFNGSLWGWKFILLIFDVALAAAVAAIFRATTTGSNAGSDSRRRFTAPIGVVGVLWCPLLLIETYEGGHIDLIGVSLLVIAFLALTLRRPVAAGTLLGLSINIKYLWPLLAIALMTRMAAGRRAATTFVIAAAAAAVLAWTPYWRSFTHAAATARMFAERWTFNDPIFELLRVVPGPRWLAMAIVLAALAVFIALLRRRACETIGAPVSHETLSYIAWKDVWLISGTALMLGPIAYPWYFMWVVPALATRPPVWLAAWVLLAPALRLVDLHYVITGAWNPMPWLWLLVDVAPAILLVIAWRRRLAVRPDVAR